jgi:hypothetical protein
LINAIGITPNQSYTLDSGVIIAVTMTTDGTKTIYSWDNDKGEIAKKTETVKRYSDSLENPLSDLANQIKKIEKLLISNIGKVSS